MIKFLRQKAIENVWFYRIIMLLISVAFVITMGWWGFESSSGQYVVATVGKAPISYEEYQKAYDNAYKLYRDLYQEDFSDELLQQLKLEQLVIQGLVERRLWLFAAEEMGLAVGDQELFDYISRQEVFRRDGRFNPEVYERVLALNRLTPPLFERLQREDLLVEKVKAVVKSTVAVTDVELQELEAQVAEVEQDQPQDPERLRRNLLLHKQQLALEAFLQALKRRIPVTINEKML